MTKKAIVFMVMFLVLAAVTAVWALTSHKDYSGMQIKDCNECHKSSTVPPNHGAFWMKEHRYTASKTPNNCGDCHQLKDCLDCHTGGGLGEDFTRSNFGADYMPKSHRSDFRELHGIKAKEDPRSCESCHDAEKFCASCHSRFPKGSLDIKSHIPLGQVGQRYWTRDHVDEARKSLQTCQSCHPDGDVCIQCHSSGKTSPHPRGWKDISGKLKSASDRRTCVKCHLPGTY